MRLEARGLSYSYSEKGRQVLSGLTATIDSGSYWCVAGPNGSGKSTFLRLASGLLPSGSYTGELSWDGRAIRDWSRLELARNLGFVGAAIRTHFPVSIGELVLQGRYARGSFWARPSVTDRKIAEACLERVGITSLAAASIAEVSAGEGQLALIARALVQEPRALILDEATANLDLRYQLRIFELLRDLNREGMTVVVVSHDLNLAAEFCPHALWLRQGTIYSRGSMEETLTSNLMQDLYDVGQRVEVGKNPFSSRPKVFWRC